MTTENEQEVTQTAPKPERKIRRRRKAKRAKRTAAPESTVSTVKPPKPQPQLPSLAEVEIDKRIAAMIQTREMLIENLSQAKAQYEYHQQKFERTEQEMNRLIQLRHALRGTADALPAQIQVQVPPPPSATLGVAGVPSHTPFAVTDLSGIGSIPTPPRMPKQGGMNIAADIEHEGGFS